MATERDRRLERRVTEVAEAALTERRFVSAIDVLVGLGWLHPRRVDEWRQGRIPFLERAVTANLRRISKAMRVFRTWARARGLEPSETAYVARSRGRRTLRFSKSGDPSIEAEYRTHWVAADLPERARERQSRPPELVVIEPLNDWTCAGCAGNGDLLIMEDAGPVCMACADLQHLLYLPAGDAALTRRAKAASRLSAVVVRFSRARRRYERQGVLVEEAALAAAEQRCLDDADARARRREREARRRADTDSALQTRFAVEIARLFPVCPAERALAIARHAAARGSGRIGRTAAGRSLEAGAVEIAVTASVRHEDTDYDDLLMAGLDRPEARDRVRRDVNAVLARWRG